MGVFVFSVIVGCSFFQPDARPVNLGKTSHHRPVPASDASAPKRAVVLTSDILSEVSLPDAPETVGRKTVSPALPVQKHSKGGAKTTIYKTNLPVDPQLMPTAKRGSHSFGGASPPGFEVVVDGHALRFKRSAKAPHSWGFDREYLYIGWPTDKSPPKDVQVSFPLATEADNQRYLSSSEQEQRAFIDRTVTIDTVSQTGLYLPAPATATLSLDVPQNAVFSVQPSLLAPVFQNIKQGPGVSDGASLVVSVLGPGQEQVLLKQDIGLGKSEVARVKLPPEGGKMTLRIQTLPGKDRVGDFVFLADPVVYQPVDKPKKVVLVFIDTLRPDHLGMYGYERPTSIHLDEWASEAARFTQARSVAPWTLPSARAALTGAQPEFWAERDNLPELLGAHGFRTDAIVTNAFLSQPFEMHRGWHQFDFRFLAPADDVVEQALAALERHKDRDQLLLVHFMEPHLPYEEPYAYSGLFETHGKPSELTHVTRNEFREVKPSDPGFERVKQYAIDRYDQNIRAVDDALVPLLRAAGPDATVVLFSDHGEEFWEHQEFEHGHSFFEELLNVPLVIRGPGFQPGVYDEPVSLLDLVPSVLQAVNIPLDSFEGSGRSLLPRTWGDEGAAQTLSVRAHGFGRPLYGEDGWGVVSNGVKWFDRGGRQAAFALKNDPLETVDLGPAHPRLAQFPALLSQELATPVPLSWVIEVMTPTTLLDKVELVVRHPAGFNKVFSSYDPRGRSGLTWTVREQELRVQLPVGEEEAVVPLVATVPDPTMADGLEMWFEIDGRAYGKKRREGRGPVAARPRHSTLLTAKGEGYIALIRTGFVPEPIGTPVEGFHSSMAEQLKELGYVE